MVHDRSRWSIKYHSKKIKRFREPADFTYFSYKVSSVKLAANFTAAKMVKLAAILLQQSHVTCSSNFATAKAVKLPAIWLAALELNLLQQNRKYSQVSGNFAAAKLVKLAAILPQRKKQSSKQQFRLQRTVLKQIVLALI